MFEFGAIWTVIGADGTSLTINNGTSGVYLSAVSGFEMPTIRQNTEDLPANDGQRAGNFYLGDRSVTLEGMVGVNQTVTARNTTINSMQLAFLGLRGDVTMKSTPTGLVAMQIVGRSVGFRLSGGGVIKSWIATLTCPDPRIYSQTQHVQAITTPSSNPSATVANAGTFDTLPSIKVTGPMGANWQLKNVTTGLLVQFNTALTGGQYVTVDMAARTAVRDNGANWYGNLVFPASTFWPLAAGNNTVSLLGSGGSSASRLDATFRDAWV